MPEIEELFRKSGVRERLCRVNAMHIGGFPIVWTEKKVL
jgi:hypothetical protein